MANPFSKHPLEVTILKPQVDKFTESRHITFLDKAVSSKTKKQGGDDLNAEELFSLGEKKPKKLPFPADILKEKEPKEKTPKEESEKTAPATRESSEVRFYPEDRISEVKDKLFIATGIPPFRQHLYVNTQKHIVPLRYKLITENVVVVDISSIFTGRNKILDIPMDINIFQAKEIVHVEALDYFTLLSDIYRIYGTTHLYLVDLLDFLEDKQEKLQEMANNDDYQFQMFYYSFILKYWPMLSFSAFKSYITDEGNFKTSYPDLWPNTRKYEEEQKVLARKYALLDTRPKGFERYITNDFQEGPQITVSVKSAVLEVENSESNEFYLQTKVNIHNLFEAFSTSIQVPFIRTRLLAEGQPLTITKNREPSLFDNDPQPEDTQRVYEKIKYRLQLPHYNTILFALKVVARDTALDEYLILTIYENGRYTVRSFWGDETQMNFRAIYKIIEDTVNPVIQQINSLGRAVFDSVRKLTPLLRMSAEFSEININLFWKSPLSRNSFLRIEKMLQEDMKAGFIQTTPGVSFLDSELGIFHFNILKGMNEYDTTQVEKVLGTANTYAYLTDGKAKQKWLETFAAGREVTITHRTTDVKVEINGLKENEYWRFYQYLAAFFFTAEEIWKSKDKQEATRETLEARKSNILKLLKSRDPELFVFKQYGSDLVYSRLCQKSHQPIPYTPEEYTQLSKKLQERAVKYWNFTTKSDMYYLCPSEQYSHLSFITGHPRGYCLPCCKITPLEAAGMKVVQKGDEGLGKKEHMYQTCIEQHVYSEQDVSSSSSRYIMNYGKVIDIGRIGHLPGMLEKYLEYNIGEEVEQGEEKIFIWRDNDYSIPNMLYNARNNKIHKRLAKELRGVEEGTSYEKDSIVWIFQVEISAQKSQVEISENPDIKSPSDSKEETPEQYVIAGQQVLQAAKDTEEVEVRYITQKQLEKALIGEKKSERAAHIKKPGYYLYGVPQNNNNVSNIGALYSIAAALNISFEEFIQRCRQYVLQTELHNLLRGQLLPYFESREHLSLVIARLFLEEELKGAEMSLFNRTKKFMAWNELFIDLTYRAFGKYILILDDITPDITGTSIKISKISENIDIILPDTIRNIEEIIPSSPLVGEKSYLLLLRRRRKTQSIFVGNHLYYPIFIFIPQMYFKSLDVEKREFTRQDEIIKLLREILNAALEEKPVETSREAWDLHAILQLIDFATAARKKITIEALHLNSKNLCYSVSLLCDGEYLLFPISYSFADNVPVRYFTDEKSTLTHEPPSHVDANYKALATFAAVANRFIISESEKRGMYRAVPEEGIPGMENITPYYPPLYPEKLLVFANKIMGIVCHGLYFYFRSAPLSEEKKILKEFGVRAPIMEEIPKFYLYYDPVTINKFISKQHSAPISQPIFDTRGLQAALYKRYIYDLFLLEFFTHLDKERDHALRNKISKLAFNTDFRDNNAIQKLYADLRELLAPFPEDHTSILEHIEHFLHTHFDRKKLVQNIAQEIYGFDRHTLLELQNLSQNYLNKNSAEQEKVRAAIRKKILQIADEIVITRKPNFTNTELQAIFQPCGSSSSHGAFCFKHKLLIEKARLYELADILAADFCNPIKRRFLLSSILLAKTRDYYHFTKKTGEEIYIKLG